MSFLSTPISYKEDETIETPYLSARLEWDSRMGNALSRAKNWRMACFLTGILSVVLVASNFYQLTQKKVVPVVIRVDGGSGEPSILGDATAVTYAPREVEIKYFLGQFIQRVRAVPSDPVLIKQNWLEAYKFLGREASNLLNAETNSDENSPLKKIGKETVTIKPVSVVRIGGGSSFQARWKEFRYGENGQALESYMMTGVFSIDVKPPTDEKSLNINPLGIYITNFQWNREL